MKSKIILRLRDMLTYIDMRSNTKQHVQRCTRVNRVEGGREKTENQRWPSDIE